MARKKPLIILPGSEAWQKATAQPLPPPSKPDQKTKKFKPEKKPKKPKKAKRWNPDLSDPFYSFERRVVQIAVSMGGGVLYALADDGTAWVWSDKWRRIPELPRRMMKEK